ncbi:hypothetical protein K7432_003922 [Basidiobolus ranarum]|uniref:Chitin-binding type-1 domain-containing protein n=1 Tax=Basidiobolus ranarum TaxID=34480 RepID=A0ABR2WZ51_9FUNG
MKFTIATVAVLASATYFVYTVEGVLSVDGTCGNGIECPAGSCCSFWGFCGVGEGFCNAPPSNVHWINGQPISSTVTTAQMNTQPSTSVTPTASHPVEQPIKTDLNALNSSNAKPEDKYMNSSAFYAPNAIFSSLFLITTKYILQ